jgi:ribosomal protein S27AE
MSVMTRQRRCSRCGSILIIQGHGSLHCPTCGMHELEEQFDPRCGVCWAAVCAALVRCFFILGWRAVSTLARGGRLP